MLKILTVAFFQDECLSCSILSLTLGLRPGFLHLLLRSALFVVQVMSDISKQDCIHNKQIPQCTKMRFYILS